MNNREIKFRVFDGKQFSYFVIGQTFGGWALSVYDDHCINGRQFQQFTGLKDKNGKDIFEGDVVESVSEKFDGMKSIGKVLWKDFAWYWEGNFGFVAMNRPERLAVIGNVFQNPELLTP